MNLTRAFIRARGCVNEQPKERFPRSSKCTMKQGFQAELGEIYFKHLKGMPKVVHRMCRHALEDRYMLRSVPKLRVPMGVQNGDFGC